MIKAILVPTVRYDYFHRFLTSLQYLPDWIVYAQIGLFTSQQLDQIQKHPNFDRVRGLLLTDKRMPPWIARTNILKKFQADVWCNADDDMEWTSYTNLEPMVEMLQDPETGMISGNWARTESLMPKKIEKLQHKFVRQPIVFTGGGMLFKGEHVRLLLHNIQPWFADDFHMSLTTYLCGYDNYRYLGSLALHRIQTKGGLLTIFQTDNTLVHPDPKYVRMRPCAPMFKEAPNNNYFYPMSSDLTEAAHALHIMNRRAHAQDQDR